MVRVLMHGCCGAMGRVITGLAADREDLKIVAGVDRNTDDSLGYPVFQSLEACDVEVDAIIDFTAAPAVDHLLDYCAEKKVPSDRGTLCFPLIKEASQTSEPGISLK